MGLMTLLTARQRMVKKVGDMANIQLEFTSYNDNLIL